ncbi:helix-turn-helix domain-containing protein [Actinokineospora sp. NPDC004072]
MDTSGFGGALKHWRTLAGLSQARLAAELGYHHSVVSRWESGERQPPAELVQRIDAVVGADGRLARLHAGVAVVPLPGDPGVVGVAWEPAHWPARLPHHGLTCPLHGDDGCAVPPADAAVAVRAAFAAGDTGGDVIHVLAAELAVYARIGDEHGPVGIDAAVEAVLHLIVRALTPAPAARPALFHLAARYAALAGQLRTLSGQHGAAMAWYGKALNWATRCDDAGLRAALLCDMSSLARLEDDGRSAVAYADALPAIAPDRAWTSALAHLYRARGHGILGDPRATSADITAARRHLDRATADDEREAPWLTDVHVESGIGAALRDVAAATADPRPARAAIAATEHAIAVVPAHLRPAAVLLALRLADCYACAGQPEAAVAIATPVLAEAAAIPMSTVGRELRVLRLHLAARWPALAPVRRFLGR